MVSKESRIVKCRFDALTKEIQLFFYQHGTGKQESLLFYRLITDMWRLCPDKHFLPLRHRAVTIASPPVHMVYQGLEEMKRNVQSTPNLPENPGCHYEVIMVWYEIQIMSRYKQNSSNSGSGGWGLVLADGEATCGAWDFFLLYLEQPTV